MKFPNYWTRVENSQGTLAARGWPDNSLQEATEHAQARLRRIELAFHDNCCCKPGELPLV